VLLCSDDVYVFVLLQAPAAFGLATFLMHEKFDRARIRRHLMIFSAAAPILAMATYFGLSGVRKRYTTHITICTHTFMHTQYDIISASAMTFPSAYTVRCSVSQCR